MVPEGACIIAGRPAAGSRSGTLADLRCLEMPDEGRDFLELKWQGARELLDMGSPDVLGS